MAQGYWSTNPLSVTIQNGTYLENNMISLAYPGRLFYLIANHPSVNVKVSNSVIWNNGPKETTANTPDGIFYYDPGATLQIDNSIVEFGWPHYKANVLNVDPLFLPLPNTDLSPLDFDYLNAYNCYSNSPMINPNLPQLYFNVTHDIKGNPRDNNPDLSSFEFLNPVTKINNNTLVSYHVYPNPAQNFINVFVKDHTNTTLRMFDLVGKEIYNYKLSNHESVIDVSSLTKGMYIIHITDENNQVLYTQKFTKN